MRILAIVAAISMVVAAGCSDGNPSAPPDAAPADAGPTDASCFDDPQTHEQIINACTTAQQIFKDSRPPLLGSDGSLPPLPL